MAARDDQHARVLILAGTTASGKTDVSIPLAKSLDAEIINADSRQIFRELKIGSAPPSPTQLSEVRHHFIAEISIAERWTAGDFARAAREIISDRDRAGKTTVVVGGSMLYLKALMDGLYERDGEPQIDYAELKREWTARGGEAMMLELEEIDPELAALTMPTDHHRILRGIGHFRATGKKLSEVRQLETEPLSQSFKLYFLVGDREETYARVNQRADLMLEQGLVEEVRQISKRGFDETNTNALRTHGYQEVFPFLRGECDYATMRAAIQQAVRHYVKRQMTWFRRDTRAVWVRRSFDESAETIAQRISNDFTGIQTLTVTK